MRDYKELDVWQRAVSLVVTVYGFLRGFPQEERYGLADQMKRAAVSIASNIAEGAGRQGNREFAKFLSIACGSTSELETQVIIAGKLGFSTETASLLEEIGIIRRQLSALIKSLRAAS